MRALRKETLDAAWASAEALIPEDRVAHRFGGGRPRVDDRVCFDAIVVRLVTGCSWETAAILTPKQVSAATLRRRYKRWNTAAMFDWTAEEAIESYDRIVGLDYSAAAVDGSIHKAPCGGPGTGKSPVDRAKSGWKLSLISDAAGIPPGWAADTAGRHDTKLLGAHFGVGSPSRGDRAFRDAASRPRLRRPTRQGVRRVVRCRRFRLHPTQPHGPCQTHPAGRALGDRTSQLVAVELRSDPAQHRPRPQDAARADRPRRSVDPHRQTHRLARPLPTRLRRLLTDALSLSAPPMGSDAAMPSSVALDEYAAQTCPGDTHPARKAGLLDSRAVCPHLQR